MAYTTGLNLISPAEFMNAISEGNDSSARDIAVFQNQIQNHQIKVLDYNTQTVTRITEQLKAMAQANNVPIIGVSETMPLGAQDVSGLAVKRAGAAAASAAQGDHEQLGALGGHKQSTICYGLPPIRLIASSNVSP
jgi:zinc/manganese transport system substrate-binding protein